MRAFLAILVVVAWPVLAVAAPCEGEPWPVPERCAAVRVAAVGRAIDAVTTVGGVAGGGRLTLGTATGLGNLSLGATLTAVVQQSPSPDSATPVNLAPALWLAIPGLAFDVGPVFTFAGRPLLTAMLRVSGGALGPMRRWGVSLGDPLELTPVVIRGEFGSGNGPGLEVSLLAIGARVGLVFEVEALAGRVKLTVEMSGLSRSWNAGAAGTVEWGAR